MSFSFHPYVNPVSQTLLMLLVAVLMLPAVVRAQCKELKIVEYPDRVEAVCVGEPLTEAQKRASQEEERRQELEAQRQRFEEQRRQRVSEQSSQVRVEVERKKPVTPAVTPPVTPQKPANRNGINPIQF